MNLMHCRYEHLQAVYQGYIRTGVSLIEFDGTQLLPLYVADDIGIYTLIPKIVSWCGISLDSAISCFFYALLIMPTLSACAAFYLMYKTWIQYFIAVAGTLCLTRFAYAVGDVYLAYYCTALGIIPWTIYYYKEFDISKHTIFGFMVGFIIGLMHYIRTYSGAGSLLFVIYLLIKGNNIFYKKMIFILCICTGLMIPSQYFNNIYKTYSSYCKQIIPNQAYALKNHLLWHSIYIGFGFLKFKNVDEIRYDDQCATNKVEKIAPTSQIYSQEYENTLKKEVVNLIKNNFLFVLMTLFAKIGILLFFLLKFCNIGLLLAYYHPLQKDVSVAFLIAALFNTIFSLITIPLPEYALGFITCIMLYTIINVSDLSKNAKNWFKVINISALNLGRKYRTYGSN